MFWGKALRLLDPESPIIRVGFESGPKGFDDIWVEYDPDRGPIDQDGQPIFREHIQCKWHVTPGSYGHADLIDPDFINANARSLLQRARSAQLTFAPNGVGARFKLLTNWRIDREDALREIINQRSGTIRLERLFGTKTDRSAMGLVRKTWREHLDIDEAELRLLARTLAFGEATDSLDDLRELLDTRLAMAGLRRVPANESAFIYDEVVFQWLGQGRLEFDRKTFRQACKRENLVELDSGQSPVVFGVKSFEHAIDRLEDRCAEVLNLISQFDERYIRSQEDWASFLFPVLRDFLMSAARGREKLRLILDAHLTLAFTAGAILNIKSGRYIEIEQRTIGRSLWAADDAVFDSAWSTLSCETEIFHEGKSALAVAIGLTHDVAPAVRAYVERSLPEIGTLLIARPSTGPGAKSVLCGAHAFALAEALTSQIKTEKAALDDGSVVHLFIACPNAFTFFLGQRQIAIGRLTLYEHDFDGARSGSYEPSLTLPLTCSNK